MGDMVWKPADEAKTNAAELYVAGQQRDGVVRGCEDASTQGYLHPKRISCGCSL